MQIFVLTVQATFISSLVANPISVADTKPLNPPQTLLGKFLHITDIHVDPNYLENSSLESYCHRNEVGIKSSIKVGKYGALGSGCDSPIDLIKSSYQFMSSKLAAEIDFIIDTGDVVRHDRDTKLPRTALEVIDGHNRAVDYYKRYFDLNRIKVIPTIGNNDEYVHDTFEKGSSLLKNLTEIWKPYGLDLTGDNDFLKGGYFKISYLNNQLLIISLNTLAWYVKNSKSYDCDVDGISKDQMLWLGELLVKSKTTNQPVYILGHIAPQDQLGQRMYKPNCYQQYLNLLGEHSSIIYGHFNGHTNFDTLSLLTKLPKPSDIAKYQLTTLTKDKPKTQVALTDLVLVLNNGPSIIPVHNPALRTYTYDVTKQGKLTGYTQYYANLTQANVDGKLWFDIEYTSKDTYDLIDLSLKSWSTFLPKLLDDKTDLYNTYSRLSTVNGKVSK